MMEEFAVDLNVQLQVMSNQLGIAMNTAAKWESVAIQQNQALFQLDEQLTEAKAELAALKGKTDDPA